MCHTYHRKISNEMKEGNVLAEVADRRISTYERDGKLKNLLKKTYLRHWVGALDARGNEAEAHSNSMDFARYPEIQYFELHGM